MSFALDIRKFTRKADSRITETVKQIVLRVFTRLLQRTPVDTGLARNSWLIGVETIPTGVKVSLSTGGGAFGAVPQEVFQAGLKELAAYFPGDTVFIVNNVDYIGALENRHSSQAPQGMVKITVREFQPIVNAIVREFN